ncbi:MAG: ABC transporter permease, partial [Pirellulales bacterium]
TSLISTYMIITVMFVGPLAARFFANTFFQGQASAATMEKLGVASPFAATFALPLEMTNNDDSSSTSAVVSAADADLSLFFGYVLWAVVYNGALLLAMMRLFQVRWRVAD